MDEKLLQSYFEGITTDEQSKLVTEWLDKSEVNMICYQRLYRLYEICLWNKQAETISTNKAKLKKWKILKELLKVAAIFTLGFLLNHLFNIQNEEISMQKVQIPVGQNAQIILADGSKVWLNGGSTLQFPTQFSNKERLVYLEGEVFFEVQAKKKNLLLFRQPIIK